MSLPHIDEKKYFRKIQRAKREARSELKESEWSRFGFKAKNFWLDKSRDNTPRIDYHSVSRKDFIRNYESKNIPVVITGAMDHWSAMEDWTVTKLAYRYRHEKFKVGEDDDGNSVFMGFKYYLHYALRDNQGAVTDDSPLYIFDPGFGKRKLHHSYRRKEEKESKHRYDPASSQAPCHLVDDFEVPKYFREDLFQLVGSRRPPFRWIVIGPARSGTGIHTDPLGTSAWNALISGTKRWVLFPPEVSKSIVNPKLSDKEAATWFAQAYPQFLKKSKNSDKTVGEELGMVEILQTAGEIVFVPGGWHHIVINLDFAIAVTQNFCSKTNLDYVWLKTRFARPKMAEKLRTLLTSPTGDIVKRAKKRKRYSERFEALKWIPAVPSSSSSNSSSTTCSSTDSDVNVICTCHGIARRPS
jgi:histone arginine demethylase JMJD6